MYYGLLAFLLTYVGHIAANIATNKIPAGCFSDYDCKYLYDHIVNDVNVSKDVCQDVYSFTCNTTKELDIYSEDFIKAQYKKLIEHIEYKLNDDSYMSKFEPIKKERDLYKLCMIHGDEQAQNLKAKEELMFLKEMYNNASHDFLWEIIDQKLYNKGFGYAFFNIRVIPHPRNGDHNIIMIEPPTFDSFTEVHEALKIIEEFFVRKDNKSHIEELLYNYVTSDKLKYIQKLVQSVTEAIFNSTTDFADNNSKVTTIGAWYNDFNKKYERSIVTKINWSHLLSKAFHEVGIDINYKNALLVKNEMYFSKLFDILFETSNEIIATTIVVKSIAENIKYIDWNLATKLKLVPDKYRSKFCLHNTELYGFSYAILKEYKKQSNSELHQLTSGIIHTIMSEIEQSPALSYSKETYLKTELDTITAYVQKPDGYFARMLENLYEGYDIKGSYFDDILRYRKIVKQKELSLLKHKSRHFKAYLPFSIMDLVHPANRFTINMYFTSLKLNRNITKPEIIYGRYGVQIASLLYALLNENKLEDYPLRRYNLNTLKHHLSAHPDYSLDKMQCVIYGVNKDNKKQFIEAMSNVYGLQIAHKALRPSKNDLPLFPIHGFYNIRQFFYLEYVKTHCYMDKRLINSIVLRDESFYTAFRKCKYSSVNCSKTAVFDRLSKNVFLIKV